MPTEMKPSHKRKDLFVNAAQWNCPIGKPDGIPPEGFVIGPPPTDFGVGRSAWNSEKKLSMHRNDWFVQFPDGSEKILMNHEFVNLYESLEGR